MNSLPPFNPMIKAQEGPKFKRRGITMHDPRGTYHTLGQQNKAAGLPRSPMNPSEAEQANPMPESQAGIPQPRNELRRFGK